MNALLIVTTHSTVVLHSISPIRELGQNGIPLGNAHREEAAELGTD